MYNSLIYHIIFYHHLLDEKMRASFFHLHYVLARRINKFICDVLLFLLLFLIFIYEMKILMRILGSRILIVLCPWHDADCFLSQHDASDAS